MPYDLNKVRNLSRGYNTPLLWKRFCVDDNDIVFVVVNPILYTYPSCTRFICVYIHTEGASGGVMVSKLG